MKVADERESGKRRGKLDGQVIRWILSLLRPHWRATAVCGALLLSSSLFTLAGPLLVRRAIDVDFANRDFHGLLLTAALYLAMLIAGMTAGYSQTVLLEKIGQRIIQTLRVDLFSRLITLLPAFFSRNPVGQLLSRVESDTESLRTVFTTTVITILTNIITLAGMIGVMVSISPRLSLVLFATVVPGFIAARLYNRRVMPLFHDVRQKTAEVYAFLEERIRGVLVVQAFGREAAAVSQMDDINRQKMEVEYPAERLANYFGHSVMFLSTMATAGALWLGGRWALAGGLTVGTLVMFLNYITQFFGPFFHLAEQLGSIQRAVAGAARIRSLLGQTSDIVSPAQPVPWRRLTESIEFRGVWHAYQNEEWVLRDVSFRVPVGQRWALVGATGGGKSSIISLLLRFYDPARGQIFFDAINIRDLELSALRAAVSLVLQDTVLFPMSILENIRLEDPRISEEQVWRALEVIGADEFVRRLPDGIGYELREGGRNLSMGERQLLSFARALVFDPQILILDEATAAVDPLAERQIQRAMNALLTGRTSLLIAHRLLTIQDCDNILVIDNGQIVEQGTHQKLLELGGRYAHLHLAQTGNHRR